MNKNTFIQLILTIILILITIIIYNKYYIKNIFKTSIEESSINKNSEKNEDQNIIKDIKYEATNKNGDQYQLQADFGEINFNDPNRIYLYNVNGFVAFKDGEKIIITSNYANFNNKTFETNFFDNVEVVRNDEKINSEELYIVFEISESELKKNPNREQNLIRINKNVIYNRTGYTLKTDIIEIDLLTKNSKIFMNNKLEKVIINKYNTK